MWVERQKGLVCSAQLGAVLKGHSSLMVTFEKIKEIYNEQPCKYYLNSPTHLPHLSSYVHHYICVYLMHHPEILQHLFFKIIDILLHSHKDIFTLKGGDIDTL